MQWKWQLPGKTLDIMEMENCRKNPQWKWKLAGKTLDIMAMETCR
jgi:hypothetical protein